MYIKSLLSISFDADRVILCGMCKEAEQAQLMRRGVTVGARMAGASVTKTAQLPTVSIGTAAKVTSAFRSMGKTSANWVENCGQQRTFNGDA